MTTFTIDSENNITAFAELPASAQGESFSTAKELSKLTTNWPTSRLADTWNSFAGIAPFDDLKPVKKFTDRKAAVTRIWKAIQRLTPGTGPQVADVAPTAAGEEQPTSKAKRLPHAKKAGSVAKPQHKKAEIADGREGSKKAIVLGLLRRTKGVTLTEIRAATDWQAHSVRGYISGTIGKKMGLTVISTKGEDGERSYSVKA